MSAHTPGPWMFDGETDDDVIEITAEARFGKVAIACIEIGFINEFDDEQRANARLIAAAPTLLEALRELVQTETDYGDETNVAVNQALDKAIRALALVTP
jgi:hypothetical protein